MRTRKTIEKEYETISLDGRTALITVELLLDIRSILVSLTAKLDSMHHSLDKIEYPANKLFLGARGR